MKENVIKEKNVKIPLYVTVYETISEWLKEGKYKPGDKLPGENILAEQLNVSRGTLRQAMLSAQRPAKAGLEKIENPLVDFCLQPVDKVETTVGFQPATQKHQEVLKLRASSIVAVINITYYSGDTVVGFAMVYMPYEVLDKSSVDLEDPDTVYQFYSKLLTSGGLYSDTKLRLGNARERLAGILNIPEGEPFLILEEELYSEYDTPVLSQKLFFTPDQHELHINRRNDRNIQKH